MKEKIKTTKLDCRVFIATSLDGYIARENGGLDWLENIAGDSQEDYGYRSFTDQVDGIIMGRGSYDKVRSFDDWPYSIPVIVMSNTIKSREIPDHLKDKVKIKSGSTREVCSSLYNDGWRVAYVDGGKIIQSFLADNLISEMIITKIPILLGGGISLFGELKQDKFLQHIATKSYPSGFVQSHYRVSDSEIS